MPKEHVMSDHALVRYIERVLGADIEEMKDAATPQIVKDAVKSGATSFKHNDVTYVIRNYKITTVIKGKRKYSTNVDLIE